MLNKNKIIQLSNLSNPEWDKVSYKYVDFSTPCKLNGEIALKDLKDIKRVLDKEKIIFWLIGGTLLGVIRDNDWIKWDQDVDLAVYNEDLIPKYNTLKESFMSLGFIFRDAQKPVGTKINLYRYRQKNSIDGLFLDPNYKNNKYRLSRKRQHPRKYFENYGTIKFKEMFFRIPYPPEKYLASMYKKWKTPIKRSRPEKEWRNKNMLRKSK